MFSIGQSRTLNGFGARLALLALALQLVLSFGHIHPLPSPGSIISSPAGGAPDLPMAADGCAVCASIAAFAALDLPRPLAFSPPAFEAEIFPPGRLFAASRPFRTRYFPTRAPPSL